LAVQEQFRSSLGPVQDQSRSSPEAAVPCESLSSTGAIQEQLRSSTGEV